VLLPDLFLSLLLPPTVHFAFLACRRSRPFPTPPHNSSCWLTTTTKPALSLFNATSFLKQLVLLELPWRSGQSVPSKCL
jgi:hypothetical protein